MQIVCISDTHSMHEKLVVPDGDMLIHAGDLTMQGAAGEIMSAFSWLNKMPHEHVVFVPGNHDYGFERNPDLVPVLRHKYPRLTVLMDSGATIAGKRIYGSPFQPYFNDWAFNFSPGPAGQEQAKKKWAEIPDDTEILITHGPVRGVLDMNLGQKHVGCEQLRDRVGELANLQLFISGHIHEDYGTASIGNTLFVNACTCNSDYRPIQPPIVVDMNDSGAHVVEVVS